MFNFHFFKTVFSKLFCSKETLLQEVSILSPDYCPAVLDFIATLKTNRQPAIPETMLMSEAVLAKDWDTAEEDEAWLRLNPPIPIEDDPTGKVRSWNGNEKFDTAGNDGLAEVGITSNSVHVIQ